MAAGAFHALALSSSGSVYAWGSDASDQLGPNATGTETSPVAVTLPVSATALAGGGQFSLALGSDGNIYAWGQGQSGELGDGGSVDQATPVTVTKPNGVSAFSALSAGNESAEALATSTSGTGQLYTWGDNELGQLGTAHTVCGKSSYACSLIPVSPLNTEGHSFAAIAMGYAQGYAVTTAGLAEAWGDDFYGQLGVGSSGSIVPTPVAVPLPAGINASQLPSGPAASFGFLLSGDPQSITVPTVGPVTYGVRPFVLGATASSGLRPVLAFGPPAVCTGKGESLVAVVVGAGTCTVSATQPGDATFDPAPPVTTRFAVARAPLTLSADDTSAPVGRVPTDFGYSLSGFVNGDTRSVVSGAASCSTTATDSSGAGTYPITCTPGSLHAANYVVTTEVAGTLTLVGGVTVTSVDPNEGPLDGGNTVSVTGTNFGEASAVHFGTTVAGSLHVESATKLSVVAPAHVAGMVAVTVTTPAGKSGTAAGDAYTYLPVPGVSSVAPASGPLGGGTEVRVTGTALTGATAVHFGAAAATDVHVVSATEVTATAPSGTGTVPVTVTTPGGTSPRTSAAKFTYVQAPTVLSLVPTRGPAAGGTVVTVSGAGLSGATAVHFGSVRAPTFTVTSSTELTATSPPGAGSVAVTVSTPGGTSADVQADHYLYLPVPTITSVSPKAGPQAGGTKVTIVGAGLGSATALHFGAAAATGLTRVSVSELTAVTPRGAGTVDVTVTTPGGTSAVSSAATFTYRARSDGASVAALGGCAPRREAGHGAGHRPCGSDRRVVRHHPGDRGDRGLADRGDGDRPQPCRRHGQRHRGHARWHQRHRRGRPVHLRRRPDRDVPGAQGRSGRWGDPGDPAGLEDGRCGGSRVRRRPVRHFHGRLTE